jgi:OmpA-OmpF porin, OOP family
MLFAAHPIFHSNYRKACFIVPDGTIYVFLCGTKPNTNSMKKIFLIASAAMLIMQSSNAQSQDRPWSLGLYAGRAEYNGDLGNRFFRFDQSAYTYYGLSVSRYLSPRFDLAVQGSYGEFGFHDAANSGSFRSRMINGQVDLRFQIIPNADAFFRPYLFAGIGAQKLDKYDVNAGADAVLNAGLGLNFRITKSIHAFYQMDYGYTNHDRRDFISNGPNDAQLMHSLGIAFDFGKMKDEDKDGVSDRRDNCPQTPVASLVDNKGCILDRDKDGIADNLDSCPDVAGVTALQGCPDKDGDGITDSKDNCPEAAGLTQFGGCPDSDGDGVMDKDDQCPTVKGLSQFSGCPDSDGDGIIDSEDTCPTEKGVIAFKGCPDTDGDGVQDKEDNCPKNVGTVANKGCPEVKEEVKKVLAQALTGVQFETGKDVIKPSSYKILDNVVKIMLENPEYRLLIEGHTDNQGDDAKNLDLSQRRANAVMKYLTDHGVAANRMRAVGYGETRAKVSNDTPAGRATNRRVEFTIEFGK